MSSTVQAGLLIVIVFWGDSMFAGPASAGYVPVFLSQLLNADIRSMAVGASSSTDTLSRMSCHSELLGGIALISTGRCNYDNAEQVKEDYLAMMNLFPHEQVLVAPLTQSMRRGTKCFDAVEALNQWLQQLVGNRFIDVHGFLRREGIRRSGLTPTRRDLRDIAGGLVPASLRADGIHPNAMANRLIAAEFAREITGRGWAEYHS